LTARAEVNLDFQYGAEATRGTTAPANRRFSEIICLPDWGGELFPHSSPAGKGVRSVTVGNQLTTIPFSGPWNFNDLAVLFALHGHYVAPVVAAGVATWTNSPSLIQANTSKTASAEWGDANGVETANYMICPTLNLVAARGGLEVNGNFMARKTTTGGAFTATPTQNAQATANEKEVDVWLVDGTGDLFSQPAKWTGSYKVEVNMPDVVVPDYPLNSSNDSYDQVVEGKPGYATNFTTRYNAAGLALLSTMEVGAIKYLGLEVLGPLISGSDYYRFRFSQALVITSVPKRETVDAVRGLTFGFAPVETNEFNYKAYQAELKNTLLAL
jgi:hypothetical protein